MNRYIYIRSLGINNSNLSFLQTTNNTHAHNVHVGVGTCTYYVYRRFTSETKYGDEGTMCASIFYA